MKVLVVIASLRMGGAERVVSLLTLEWARDHDVALALFDASGQAFAHGGKLIDLGLAPASGSVGKAMNLVRRIARLRKVMIAERPDRIVTFMESANFPTILAAAAAGMLPRLSVSVHVDPATLEPFQIRAIPWLYRWPQRVIGVSRGIAVALAKRGVPEKRIAAIANPAAPGALPDTAAPIVKPRRFILGVGRLHEQKGFDRLIAAFHDIVCSGSVEPDLTLVILGEGAERAALEAQVAALGLGGRVLLPGAVGDVASWYSEALCFALSSRYEGWPMVLIEAMSQGCPPVAFTCRFGPDEIVTDGKDGYLVPEGDVPALGEAILRLLGDDAGRRAMGEAARVRAAEFHVGRIARLWLGEQPG